MWVSLPPCMTVPVRNLYPCLSVYILRTPTLPYIYVGVHRKEELLSLNSFSCACDLCGDSPRPQCERCAGPCCTAWWSVRQVRLKSSSWAARAAASPAPCCQASVMAQHSSIGPWLAAWPLTGPWAAPPAAAPVMATAASLAPSRPRTARTTLMPSCGWAFKTFLRWVGVD